MPLVALGVGPAAPAGRDLDHLHGGPGADAGANRLRWVWT